MLPENNKKSCTAMMSAATFAAIILLPFSGAQTAQAQSGGQEYMLDKQHTKVGFAIGHMVVSTTDGIFTDFDGKLLFQPKNPENSIVDVTVSTASIDTNEKGRDEHLRTDDFFAVDKYPAATFKSTQIKLTNNKSGQLTGVLTMLGIAKTIVLNVTLQSQSADSGTLDFVATGTFLRSAFGMNGYRPLVGDEVTLNINAEFDRK